MAKRLFESTIPKQKLSIPKLAAYQLCDLEHITQSLCVTFFFFPMEVGDINNTYNIVGKGADTELGVQQI